MKFITTKNSLLHTATWVARNLPRNPVTPSFNAVTITALDDGTVLFDGADENFTAHSTINATVHTAGSVAVSGKLLAEVIEAIPNDDKTITFASNGKTCEISKGKLHVTLASIITPNPLSPVALDILGSVKYDVFVDAVSQVAFAAAKTQELPSLMGVRIEFGVDNLTLVATDRFRLAKNVIPWKPMFTPPDNTGILFNSSKLVELVKSFRVDSKDSKDSKDSSKDSDDELVFAGKYTDFNVLRLEHKGRQSVSRLFDPDWIDYNKLIPTSFITVVDIDRRTLMESLKTAVCVAFNEKESLITLTITAGELILQCNNPNGEHVEDTILVEKHGVDVTVVFRASYLHDAIKVFHEPTIRLYLNGPSKPAIIIAATEKVHQNIDEKYITPTTDYLNLLMPSRII